MYQGLNFFLLGWFSVVVHCIDRSDDRYLVLNVGQEILDQFCDK